MASTELEKRKREEYEMQLFGFHSRIVYDTFQAMIQEAIQSKCQRLIQSISEKFKPDERGMKMLQRDERKLIKSYYRGTRAHLPALENCVNRIICVPPHVLLEEDKEQIVQYSEDEFKEKQENLEGLQMRLKRAKTLNALLKDELKVATEFEEKTADVDMLCKVINEGSKYPDVSKTMVKLFGSYKDLEHQFNTIRDAPSIHTNSINQYPLDELDIDAIS